MQLAKQEALEAIGKLPDDVDMDEIMYRLYGAVDTLGDGNACVSRSKRTPYVKD